MSSVCTVWLIPCLPWAKPQITWNDVIGVNFQIYFTSYKRLPWQTLLFIDGNLPSFKIPSKLKGNFCTVKWQMVLRDFTLLPVFRDGPRKEGCVSDSNLFPKRHVAFLTGSVIGLLVTGFLRKLNCDFQFFLASWNLTVNLLIYFPYKTFIWSLWTMDFISTRPVPLGDQQTDGDFR